MDQRLEHLPQLVGRPANGAVATSLAARAAHRAPGPAAARRSATTSPRLAGPCQTLTSSRGASRGLLRPGPAVPEPGRWGASPRGRARGFLRGRRGKSRARPADGGLSLRCPPTPSRRQPRGGELVLTATAVPRPRRRGRGARHAGRHRPAQVPGSGPGSARCSRLRGRPPAPGQRGPRKRRGPGQRPDQGLPAWGE